MSKIKVGQVLKIKMIGMSGDHLVIDTADEYHVFEFKTVKILPSGVATKVREWYLTGGSMHGHGLPVEDDEYKVVGSASFKVETKYTISKVKKVK
jgi:hypothetical protein